MTLLDETQTTGTFGIGEAITYMKENGEYIRYTTEHQDFYMYINTEKKPVTIDGKRQLKEFSNLVAVSQYGNTVNNIEVSSLLDAKCSIMQFTEEGNPVWGGGVPSEIPTPVI